MNLHPPSPLDQTHFSPASVFAAGLKLHHLANTAYPIGHLTTMRPYRVPNPQVQKLAARAWQEVNRLGLYVHIPFCESRCKYCEYCVVAPEVFQTSQDEYFDLLLREFELYRQAADTPAKTLVGFDLGGGTPSAVDASYIARVVEAAHRTFHLSASVTISIETTPRIAARQPDKLRAYYAMGIRRISMGVQTVNPRLLAEVGRTHTSLEDDQRAAEAIRLAGFGKFNVDVMYGFANQSLDGLEVTLQHVIDLSPEYITLYRMRYKGTRLAEQAAAVTRQQVNEQYAHAKTMLQAVGYTGTPGKNTFSRLVGDVGTSDYLTERVIHGTPYLGLGLGAQSLSEVTLSYNSGAADKRLDAYRRHVLAGKLPLQDLYHLSPQAAMGKMISVAFYFGEVDLVSFQRKFGLALEQAFPAEVAFVLGRGLMEYVGGVENNGSIITRRVLRLTEDGVKVYNGVIALFYAGAVKKYLLNYSSVATNGESYPQTVPGRIAAGDADKRVR
jgi:oxygen-independent coproporphyrinogen-3 oxidase